MFWELHLTVDGAPAALDAFAAGSGARRLRLEVEQDGAASAEEMMTLRVVDAMAAAQETVAELALRASALEVTLLRAKVEAPIEATAPALYLEHHVRVRLPPAALPRLEAIAREHRAHLSRRPRLRATDLEERYVTARFGEAAAKTEAVALAALLQALARAAMEVAKVERERIVIDERMAAR